MKNFATFISKEMIQNIVTAHNNVYGNDIEPNLLSELKTLNEDYLLNLKCSDELKKFIDRFLCNVKDYMISGDGSIYVTNFIDLQEDY